MKHLSIYILASFFLFQTILCSPPKGSREFERIKYNDPDLIVDLGVGLWAWPLPMDYDGDGDYDLLVSCPDKPYNGIYFFENTQGNIAMPVFKPGVRLSQSFRNIMPSYIGERVRLLVPAKELIDIKSGQFEKIYKEEIINTPHGRVRANQWRYCDYKDDGDLDLLVGVGDWSEYGWDDAFDENGSWTNGPLHGYVYLVENMGSAQKPDYRDPVQLLAEGHPIDVYGMPSPNLADFDNDGDFDLICGEFLDKFTWFENIGTRSEPKFAKGRFLEFENEPIQMDLEMIVPVALDWDKDGDVDLVVGQEDGRVAFIENMGTVKDNMPQFAVPRFFKQEAKDVKFGALVTPYAFDWDDDGDDDLICGNTAGYIGFVENLYGDNPPQWAEPVYVQADGKDIRIQAGPNGSIQGPCEAKWGYTTLSVADWDHDDLPDIVVNSIWGKVVWYRNTGTRTEPQLASAQSIEVEWNGTPPKPEWFWWNPQGNELATQWRTTPYIIDWNKDGLNDLVMLDHEGYLTFFERARLNDRLGLLPGHRMFYDERGNPLQLNTKRAGGSGRRKFCFVDWDLDGRLDLLLNSKNIDFYQQIGETENGVKFQNMGLLDDHLLAGHTTSPTIVDWNKNGIPDLLVGAEDGFLYYLENTHSSSNNTVNPKAKIIAHRGASSVAPENTLAAFEKAIEFGADYFELDVHLSADDSLIVIHDETVDKTTDGEGRVDELTYLQLQALDAGLWFNERSRGERLPTLKQALERAKRDNINVCIEIKTGKSGTVEKIHKLVENLDMENRVIIFSFSFDQVAESKKLKPNIPALFLVGKMRRTAIDSAASIDADAVGAGSETSADLIKYAHKKDLEFWKWTVNDYGETRRLLSWDIDGIITDYPQRLTALLKRE